MFGNLDLDSSKILTGIGAIVNTDNVKPGLNLDDIENILSAGSNRGGGGENSFAADIAELKRKLNFISDPAEEKSQGADVSTHRGSRDYGRDSTSGGAEEYRDTYSGEESSSRGVSAEEYPDLSKFTKEKEHQSHIDDVVGPGGFSFAADKTEDDKCAALAEIDSLTTTLTRSGVDLQRIKSVDQNSSIGEIESVLRTLRMKNEADRYGDLAEEIMLLGAQSLESIFDGKATWLGGRVAPDLTGWSAVAQPKFRRVRNDVGTAVGSTIQEFGVGPIMRMFLELIPSMMLYSRKRKATVGKISETELDAARARISNFNSEKIDSI